MTSRPVPLRTMKSVSLSLCLLLDAAAAVSAVMDFGYGRYVPRRHVSSRHVSGASGEADNSGRARDDGPLPAGPRVVMVRKEDIHDTLSWHYPTVYL